MADVCFSFFLSLRYFDTQINGEEATYVEPTWNNFDFDNRFKPALGMLSRYPMLQYQHVIFTRALPPS